MYNIYLINMSTKEHGPAYRVLRNANPQTRGERLRIRNALKNLRNNVHLRLRESDIRINIPKEQENQSRIRSRSRSRSRSPEPRVGEAKSQAFINQDSWIGLDIHGFIQKINDIASKSGNKSQTSNPREIPNLTGKVFTSLCLEKMNDIYNGEIVKLTKKVKNKLKKVLKI